jgi:hypothetical protein
VRNNGVVRVLRWQQSDQEIVLIVQVDLYGLDDQIRIRRQAFLSVIGDEILQIRLKSSLINIEKIKCELSVIQYETKLAEQINQIRRRHSVQLILVKI